MSFCRWSSDNFDCDVYVYEHCDGGFPIHLASCRLVGVEACPKLDTSEPYDPEAFLASYQAQHAWIADAERAPIGLPHDGETWWAATAGECADKLEELRRIGYHVPQYAIDDLRHEAEHP